ncbi:Fc.00g079990.m01.CDS01 [Cosmosporella sp. VM-42]
MTTRYTAEPETYDQTTTSSSSAPTETSSSQPRRRLSAHAQADAARAMQHTNSWKPVYERRQSFSKEDQKHVLCMRSVGIEVKTELGFTERS